MSVLKKLLRLSLGATAQQFVETASWLFLVRIIATFGPPAVAGFTVAMRIFAFVFLPALGLSNAATTLWDRISAQENQTAPRSPCGAPPDGRRGPCSW